MGVFQDKKSGIWKISYDLLPGPDGKRKRRQESLGMSGGKKQAEALLRERLVARDKGLLCDPGNLTIKDHFPQWIARIKEDRSPATIEGYQIAIYKHIIPVLGKLKAAKVRPATIQAFVDQMKAHLSPKSIKNIHGVLRAGFEELVRLEVIPSNPARKVRLPSVKRKPIVTATNDDRYKILQAIGGSKYRIPILIIIATGARRGEALALKWEDFDAEREILVIRRAVVQVKGGLVIKGTKSGNERAERIPPTLVAVLEDHRKTQQEQRKGFEHKYHDDGWICADVNGKQLTPGGLDRFYGRMKATLGIDVTLHGHRHTQATDELNSGIPDSVVSKRLGHSTINITHDIYGHLRRDHQLAASELAEDRLNPAKPSIRIAGQ